MMKQNRKKIMKSVFLLMVLWCFSHHQYGLATTESIEIDTTKEAFVHIGYDLPIVIVDTSGAFVSGIDYTEGHMRIIDHEGVLNFPTDAPTLEQRIGIKVRGKSSRRFPKKQYRFELWNKSGGDKSRKLLGLPKDSDWILYGPFKDKSLMRNALAYDIAGKMMVYAPRTAYCELFLIDDGETKLNESHYRGLYLLIEDIKQTEDRVPIYPSFEGLEETSFLASKDVPTINDDSVTTYGKETIVYPREIEINYPNKNVSDTQLTYISRTISEFERVLYSSNYNRGDGGYKDYIDINSFIDYYILNEFFRNTDAGVFSTYFYKDYGEKIRIGPVWDFNEAMGNDSDTGDYFEYTGFHMYNDFWYKRLMTDRAFVSDLIDRYHLLRRTFLSEAYLIEWIEETSEELAMASKHNYEKWPFELCTQAEVFENNWVGDLGYEEALLNQRFKEADSLARIKEHAHKINEPEALLALLEEYNLFESDIPGMSTSYQEEIEGLKAFMVNRGRWMDENIEHLLKFTY